LIRWFAWLTAVNVVGVIFLALAVIAPGVLAYFFVLPRASVEMKLVPVEEPRERAATDAAPRARDAEPRVEIPAGFRAPDLSPRPWEELPGGEVRFRE